MSIVYSTDKKTNLNQKENQKDPIVKNKQFLEVWLEKKKRAGKTVVLIKGFIGSLKDLKILSQLLKKKCGVGGSVKKGEIIIQGNVRDKVIEILEKEDYKVKKVGG